MLLRERDGTLPQAVQARLSQVVSDRWLLYPGDTRKSEGCTAALAGQENIPVSRIISM
jgi:hypothetical protein